MQTATVEHPTELTHRTPTIADVRRGCGGVFEYVDLAGAEIVHAIACGEGWALVIGNPGWASYEWIYVACSGTCYVGPPHYVPRAEEDEQWEHSNCGFGSATGALLEVLLRVEGTTCRKCGRWMLPDEIDVRCRRCEREEEEAEARPLEI